jgi:cell division protein FtsA
LLFKRKASLQTYHVPMMSVLDLGSSKFMCAQAHKASDVFRVAGFGKQGAAGMIGGRITDVSLCEDSILRAIESSETQSGEVVRDVTIGLGGPCVQNKVIRISVNIGGDVVEEYHIENLFQELLRYASKEDKELLCFIPQSYTLDGAMGVLDPRGMIANELSGSFFVTFAQRIFMENVMNVLDRCHLNCKQFISTGYASSVGSLIKDETILGVTHIDIGGRYTDVTTFREGNIVQTFSLPVGGDHITQDIARGLGVGVLEAERLKTLYGSAIIERGDDQKFLPESQFFNGVSGKQVTKQLLSTIIRSRVEEIFEMIMQQIKINILVAGQRYVLTGGASMLHGIKEKAELMLRGAVRLGHPTNIVDMNKLSMGLDFSVCAGLFALVDKNNQEIAVPKHASQKYFWDRIKSWLYDTI